MAEGVLTAGLNIIGLSRPSRAFRLVELAVNCISFGAATTGLPNRAAMINIDSAGNALPAKVPDLLVIGAPLADDPQPALAPFSTFLRKRRSLAGTPVLLLGTGQHDDDARLIEHHLCPLLLSLSVDLLPGNGFFTHREFANGMFALNAADRFEQLVDEAIHALAARVATGPTAPSMTA